MVIQRLRDMRIMLLIFGLAVAAVPTTSFGQDISPAAEKFLQSLPDKLHSQALFSFEDDERFNINFVPMVRKGPTFHDFNTDQKNAAIGLLKASMSASGYSKANQ